MEPMNRRRFLARGGAVIAAAGVAGVVPAVAADAAGTPRTESLPGRGRAPVPAPSPTGTTGSPGTDGPVVAHLTDLHAGEVTVYAGHRAVKVRDTQLANLLHHATRS